MIPSVEQARKEMIEASKAGWGPYRERLHSNADDNVVKVEWKVDYEPLGHDMILEAKIKVAESEDSLLQVWLQDLHPGFWIPEFRPWVASVVEFTAEQDVKYTHVGLFDSKWQKEDAGETYFADLWGYVLRQGEVKKFAYAEEFVYPG